MSDVNYTIVGVNGRQNLTAVIDGELYQTSNDNERYDDIVNALVAGDADKALNLFSPAKDIVKRFQRLTERVTLNGGVVFFDGDAIQDVVADHIIEMADAGDDFMPLVNFLEKVQTNPNEHSRTMLYKWLKSTGGFTIDTDGDIVCYKGVKKVNDGRQHVSTHSGTAIVDGETITNDFIPNPIGSIVEMPRSEVTHDPSLGCHSGLHVGTWEHARQYGNVRLHIKVNPRDVVSVPTDAREQKMRVCRYKIISTLDKPFDERVLKAATIEDFTAGGGGHDEDEFDASEESSWIGMVYWYPSDDEDNTGNVEVWNQDGACIDDVYDVPYALYLEFKAAVSKGQFYNERIKGQFKVYDYYQ